MPNRVLLSIVVLMILLFADASCRRDPHEDTRSRSNQPQAADVDSNKVANHGNASRSSAEPSAANGTAIGFEDPSAARLVAREIDLNSGDLRGADIYEVYESELSKEVRRLGIPIPESRRWVIISLPPSTGITVNYVYSDLLPTIDMLLGLFDRNNVPDKDRRVVLERLMTSLRKDKPPTAIETTRKLVVEVAGKYGEESPFRSSK